MDRPTNVSEYVRDIKVFPNPVSSVLSVNKKVDLEIFNYLGNKIISAKQISSLDVSRLTPGIYIMHVIHNEKVSVIRFVKK